MGKQDQGDCRKHLENRREQPIRCSSWMLVLIKAVLQKTGSEYLTDVWPNMEVFFHGGISFEPYRDQYKALIPSDRMHYMETYNASEGFFGLQNNPEEHSLC